MQQLSPKLIFNSINSLRNNPQSVFAQLKDQLNKFQSNTVYRNNQGNRVRTMSGKAGWQDAMLSLERQKPKPPLKWNQLLSKSAEQYKLAVQQNQKVNPFDVVKSFCVYEGNISFISNESDVDNNMAQLMAALVVCDGDEKKAARVSIFHPSYQQFGCAIHTRQKDIVIYMIFAQKIIKETNNKNKSTNQYTPQLQSNNYQSHQKGKVQKSPIEYLINGRQFITELNKIRKDPKGYIVPLKNQMSKFKEDHKTLVTDYGLISTKEGEAPYQDLISQLESQYALPTIREVQGLSIAALQQLNEMIAQVQKQTQADIIIDKFCTMSEGIRSIKLKDVGGMPISAMLIRLILGDGDKKRTARRKLLSPICKAIGCSISEDMLVLNVGQTAKDNKDAVQEYMSNLQQKSKVEIKKQKIIVKQKQIPNNSAINAKKGGKIVVKKTSRSHNQQIDGLMYKVTVTKFKYQDQTEEEIVEEELLS